MSNEPAKPKRTQNSFKDYFAVSEVFTYFFRKKDPEAKPNFNLRMMHGINKISIIMFLVGIILFMLKLAFR